MSADSSNKKQSSGRGRARGNKPASAPDPGGVMTNGHTNPDHLASALSEMQINGGGNINHQPTTNGVHVHYANFPNGASVNAPLPHPHSMPSAPQEGFRQSELPPVNNNNHHQQQQQAQSNPRFNQFRQLLDSEAVERRPPLLQHISEGPTYQASLINEFKDLVFELSTNPAAFDNYVPYVIESLNMCEYSIEVCDEIVSTIVKWAIVHEGFRYTGSKLAHYLALPGQLKFDFLTPFLKCVKKEGYQKLENLVNCTTSTEHTLLEGIMMFLAELYLNMGVAKLDPSGQHILSISRIDYLQRVLKEAILKILELANSDKPLETVGKILKLTGAALAECDQAAGKEEREKTDRIFVHVDAIANEDYTSPRVKNMLKRVLQLKANNWQALDISGTPSSANGNSATPSGFPPHNKPDNYKQFEYCDVPVFFLSDGTPIPAHEDDFVEMDGRQIGSSTRFMYLHGGGGDSTSSDSGALGPAQGTGGQGANAGNFSEITQMMAHTLNAEEEDAFNEFLAQMDQ